jgi:hypothetical protein
MPTFTIAGPDGRGFTIDASDQDNARKPSDRAENGWRGPVSSRNPRSAEFHRPWRGNNPLKVPCYCAGHLCCVLNNMSAVYAEQKVMEPKTRALLGAAGFVLLTALVSVGVIVSQGLGLRGSIDVTTTGSVSEADQP